MNELGALLALCYLQAEGEVVLQGLIPDEDMDLLEDWMISQYASEKEQVEEATNYFLQVLNNKINELKGI